MKGGFFMMLASQIRANARESLKGRWGKAALVTLVFAIISYLLSLLNFIPLIGGLAVSVISVPLSYGLIVTFIKFKRNESFTYTTFLSQGFENFGKVWSVVLWTVFKLLLWVIVIVVSIFLMITMSSLIAASALLDSSSASSAFYAFVALVSLVAYIVGIVMLIIKGYSYSMIYFILYDNPTLTGKEIVEKSATIMKNNKWRYFCLNLSFIGWAILAGFTFGIGMLWLVPYIQIANVHFYEDLKNNSEKPESEDNSNVITEN